MATKTRIRKVPCGKICVQHTCWGERMWAYWVTWKKSDMECIEKHLSGKRMVLAWDPVPAGNQKALPRSPSHAPEAGASPQGWHLLVWGKSIPVSQFPGYFLELVQVEDGSLLSWGLPGTGLTWFFEDTGSCGLCFSGTAGQRLLQSPLHGFCMGRFHAWWIRASQLKEVRENKASVMDLSQDSSRHFDQETSH